MEMVVIKKISNKNNGVVAFGKTRPQRKNL